MTAKGISMGASLTPRLGGQSELSPTDRWMTEILRAATSTRGVARYFLIAIDRAAQASGWYVPASVERHRNHRHAPIVPREVSHIAARISEFWARQAS